MSNRVDRRPLTLQARFTQLLANLRFDRREHCEQLFDKLVPDLTRILGPQDRLTFETEIRRGVLLLGTNRRVEAIAHYRRLKEKGCNTSAQLSI